MRGHNICFHYEIRKLSLNYPQYPLLSGTLIEMTVKQNSGSFSHEYHCRTLSLK